VLKELTFLLSKNRIATIEILKTMKAVKFLSAFMFILMVCQYVNSAETDTLVMEHVPLQLIKVLSLKVDFPKEAIEQHIEGVVTACFLITTEGKIKINCMNGHPILLNHVRKKLENLHTKDDYAMANKPMIIRFRFENPNY